MGAHSRAKLSDKYYCLLLFAVCYLLFAFHNKPKETAPLGIGSEGEALVIRSMLSVAGAGVYSALALSVNHG